MDKSISAFYPALNEEGEIEKLTQDLLGILSSRFKYHEVIIVNDGSTDGTKNIADWLCRQNNGHVTAIHHTQSKGYGNALKAGFNTAQYDLIFYTDGDNQFDMHDLHKALSLIDTADIVVGYRHDRKDPSHRLFLSKGYNALIRLLFGLNLKDVDCSFKLFKRRALEEISIESDGYFIDTEIMVKAQKLGLRIAEIPVKHLPRNSGVSKVKFKHIFVTIHEILDLWNKLH